MKKAAIIMFVSLYPLLGFSQKANDNSNFEKGNDLLVIPESFKFDIDKFKNRDLSLGGLIEKQAKKNKSNMPVLKSVRLPHIIVMDVVDSKQTRLVGINPPWWID